ncbi:hypothetical protein TNCV_4459461 [Trichonephila clavipes]|nr:hypothetical protein TNCV_4459461 [Trichonephila clavipes]
MVTDLVIWNSDPNDDGDTRASIPSPNFHIMPHASVPQQGRYLVNQDSNPRFYNADHKFVTTTRVIETEGIRVPVSNSDILIKLFVNVQAPNNWMRTILKQLTHNFPT